MQQPTDDLPEQPTAGAQRSFGISRPANRDDANAVPERRAQGDASQTVQRTEHIYNPLDATAGESKADTEDQEMEYVMDDDEAEHRQALGPAQDNEAARLQELQLLDPQVSSAPEGDSPDTERLFSSTRR